MTREFMVIYPSESEVEG